MTNSGPTIRTLGCRLNEYESEAISEIAAAEGLTNATIVNTCAVTAEAVRKSRQAVRRAARENPKAKLIVTGCASQIDAKAFADLGGVDAVIGNRDKLDPKLWNSVAKTGGGKRIGTRILVDDIMAARHPSNHLVSGTGTRTRAHVQIQNGCDHRCTFCIIPYGRGNSRSVPADKVIAQVRLLAERGVPEVVLSGVDLTSWGQDLPDAPCLGDLVARILGDVETLPRLRLSSLDVVEVDSRLMELLTTEDRLMPHLHLSLQAGHNLILKRMKRRHLREDAISFCRSMRQARPGIAYGADLIAGFPTETDDMFASTLDLVEECGLTWLHVFPYSSRTGTPAARMPQVEPAKIRRRAARLRELADQRVQEHLAAQIGTAGDVLAETPHSGRTRQFAEVEFTSAVHPGIVYSTEFTGINGRRLSGRVIGQD